MRGKIIKGLGLAIGIATDSKNKDPGTSIEIAVIVN
jgi:hypothetical protein